MNSVALLLDPFLGLALSECKQWRSSKSETHMNYMNIMACLGGIHSVWIRGSQYQPIRKRKTVAVCFV